MATARSTPGANATFHVRGDDYGLLSEPAPEITVHQTAVTELRAVGTATFELPTEARAKLGLGAASPRDVDSQAAGKAK